MFEYFYHEILRRTIIGFGTLFNNIKIKSTNSSGDVISEIKVPLAYGPKQKFLARLEQSPEDLNNPVRITLPRMSFEFTGLNYDPARKVTTTQTFLTVPKNDPRGVKKVYMPVPYNMEFDLTIMTKHNDDMLQIVEQILPYFQPSYTLTINLIDTIGESRDVPFTLNSILMDDDYEGDFTTRRALTYTLKFSAKTYLFGPVPTTSANDIIKKVNIGFVAGDSNSTQRDITFRADPVATKSYTDSTVTTLETDLQISTAVFDVNDSSSFSVNSYIVIDSETMKVTQINGNSITVERGSYGSKITQHVSGTEIQLITSADNQLVEFGDNFGFDLTSF